MQPKLGTDVQRSGGQSSPLLSEYCIGGLWNVTLLLPLLLLLLPLLLPLLLLPLLLLLLLLLQVPQASLCLCLK
jgi:hypothetical protein